MDEQRSQQLTHVVHFLHMSRPIENIGELVHTSEVGSHAVAPTVAPASALTALVYKIFYPGDQTQAGSRLSNS